MATQDEKIKWVEGTPFMVDGFRFANPKCKHYLLTHFHSDHTTGLYKSFAAGTIYTSRGTANLVTALIGVNPERVVGLPMNKPVTVAGFEVTLINANHCPAAVMFLIRDPRPGGRLILHTGDFRAAKSVCQSPLVKTLRGRLDVLYLDTTYCGPRHAFADQEEVLSQVKGLVRTELERDPHTLFLVGTYSIGKERVLEEMARAARSRCLVSSRKARMMRLAGSWKKDVYVTHDAAHGGLDGAEHARVRAVPLGVTTSVQGLKRVLREAREAGAPFTSVVAVRPTGWTHSNSAKVGMARAREARKSDASEGNRDDNDPYSEVVDTSDGLQTEELYKSVSGTRSSSREEEASRDGDLRSKDMDKVSLGYEDQDQDQEEERDFDPDAWAAEEDGEIECNYGEVEETGMVINKEDSSTPPETWTGKKPWIDGNARMYALPYSEHSSFIELRNFVKVVRPKTIVPTVNASSAASVEKMLRHFLEFMDLSRDKSRLDSYFRGSSPKIYSGATTNKSLEMDKALSIERRAGPDHARAPCPQPELFDLTGTSPSEGPTTNIKSDAVKIEGPDPASALLSPLLSCRSPGVPHDESIGKINADVALEQIDVGGQRAIMADIQRRAQQQQQERNEIDTIPCVPSGYRDEAECSPAYKNEITQKRPVAKRTGKRGTNESHQGRGDRSMGIVDGSTQIGGEDNGTEGAKRPKLRGISNRKQVPAHSSVRDSKLGIKETGERGARRSSATIRDFFL